jgi:glycosyltransferase involved in cell wall biosynthesis
MNRVSISLISTLALIGPAAGLAAAPDFTKDIRPILAKRCMNCHGPDAAKRKADLRLDTKEGLLHPDVVTPGKAAESELIKRLLTKDEVRGRRLWQRRMLYRTCHRVHTVSEIQRIELQQLRLGEGKLSAIPNGVDTKRYHPRDKRDARLEIGIPEDGLVLGIVGRFGRYKGHARLISAFEALAAQRPELRLLVVGGGGPEEETICGMWQNSPFRDRIILAGFQADPVSFYQAMDLLVLPSTNEGMSNATLEAMACGVPVLGHGGCGHDSMIQVEQNGWISDLSTVAGLTGKLQNLLGAESRFPLAGDLARRTIESRFSMTAMLRAYEDLYRKEV